MPNDKEHHRLVNAFLRAAKNDDPDAYEQLCQEHPTLSIREWKHVHFREDAVGLVGLEPVKLPIHIAIENDLEMMEFDDD